MTFQCHYQPQFVVLAYTISVLGAYCALQLAAQIPVAKGRTRTVWLTGAAIAMGGGAIWSMHFIAMIACRLPVPVTYDFPITLASLLVAIAGAGIGLRMASTWAGRFRKLLAGGVITGLAVAAMHYTGMAAMRLPARTTYRPGLVAASILIAVFAATAALWIAFNVPRGWKRLGASLVMGIAVCGMHYTGMAAAIFVPVRVLAEGSTGTSIGSDGLAYMVFGVTLLILTLLSVGARALSGKLSIAAKISILTGLGTLVAVGGTAVLLVRMQSRLAREQVVLQSGLVQVESALGLQVTFKQQVQEWKNVLLRGSDEADFKQYTDSFFREEARVQADGQSLLAAMTAPANREMVARFLEQHRDLGQHYRSALDGFVRGGRTDYRSADRKVRGEDRPPTELIGQAVLALEKDVALSQSALVGELVQEQRGTALTAAVLFAGLVLVGIWIAKRISDPIQDLSLVVARVSAERDYTIRAPRTSGDEVGLLADGFNEMLGEIQNQHSALQDAQRDLEHRVARRTGELKKANEELSAEIGERERRYEERVRLAAFTADVGGALTRSESLPSALEASAEAMVQHLGATFASIWVLNPKEPVLERKASACAGAEVPDALERIPVGQFRIGRIAQDGKPRIVDFATDPPEEGDKDWATRQGMVSFGGHPLAVGGIPIGVMAMFSRQPITAPMLHAMATVADAIALAIDRARAAESLQASETLTRSILEGMREGLVTLDSRSRIKSVNSSAERLFQYPRAELVGKPISCLIPDGGGPDAEAFLREARRRAMGHLTEWQGRRKDGSTFPFELSLFEFWTSEGRHFGGAIKDLSERHEVDRLKREFVSTVSHELRTPLTSIRGALGLVAGGAAGALPAQAKSLLEIALKNSERLGRLVNDILDMEKIESGQLEFKMEELELAPLLEAAAEELRSYAGQYGVALAVENAAPGARVRADADRFTQVIANLLSNAVKFSPRGGTVRLSATSRIGVVRLEVEDHGPGISEEFRSRIFGRFQQADSSDTRQKGGTGLGLAITRLIVERLGGTVGFETEIGHGTTFWAELPAVPLHAVRIERAPDAVARPRILHVDDDPDLPTIIEAALSGFADVDVARGLREARRKLAATRYDLVVLDVGLPDGSGLELPPLLHRPDGTPIPFIVFTAHDISREAGAAAAAVLIKSRAMIAELAETVKSILAGAGEPAHREIGGR